MKKFKKARRITLKYYSQLVKAEELRRAGNYYGADELYVLAARQHEAEIEELYAPEPVPMWVWVALAQKWSSMHGSAYWLVNN